MTTPAECEDLKVDIAKIHADLHANLRGLKADFRAHKEDFEKHEKAAIESRILTVSAQNANTAAIHALAESTQGLVEAWSAAEGVVKVGSSLGRLVKWLAGFGLLAGVLNWLGIPIPPAT
jgi:hypothetical protein